VIEREARPDCGFGYRRDNPYEDDGWFGREQATDYVSVDAAAEPPRSKPVNHVREERYEAPPAVDRAPPPPTRRLASPTVNTWMVNGQLPASNNSTLTFRPPRARWYRTKQSTIALIAVAAAAVAVPLVLLVWPDGSSTGPGQSTSVAPQASTIAAHPSPTTPQPTPVEALPPLPPPPPPPSAEDAGSADSQPYPRARPTAPEPTQKPDIGVTRTPVTRAPISVAPQPRQPPQNNSATPGDGRKGWRCGGWC
jgi:hypothetical protein